MNRRSFISQVVAFLACLPFIGWLFAPVAKAGQVRFKAGKNVKFWNLYSDQINQIKRDQRILSENSLKDMLKEVDDKTLADIATTYLRHDPADEQHPLLGVNWIVTHKSVDKEQPEAFSIPFATLPSNKYIQGPRYKVEFNYDWDKSAEEIADRLLVQSASQEIQELVSMAYRNPRMYDLVTEIMNKRRQGCLTSNTQPPS